MGNAPDDIKKIVDEVTDTNNEEGVAKFLEKVYKEVFWYGNKIGKRSGNC